MLTLVLLAVLGIVNLFLGFGKNRQVLLPVAVLSLVATTLVAVAERPGILYWDTPFAEGMLSNDPVSTGFTLVLLITATLVLPLAQPIVRAGNIHVAEFFALMLFSLVGAIMMVRYENLIMLFVGVEILSIAMYVLAGSDKNNLRSGEAALKYFLMGAFFTGILLFGVALLYAETGSFSLSQLGEYFGNLEGATASPLVYVGVLLILIGMLFKVSAAPFHFWTPDVYEGSPNIFTAFMSTIVKTAGFAALYRILSFVFYPLDEFWAPTLALMAVATLAIGNLTAVFPSSFKRVMAYSSISHAGYLLLGLIALSDKSPAALIFYSLTYGVATVSAFGVLILVSQARQGNEKFEAFNGLYKTNPFLAGVLTLSMCSLAGIPLTGGFFGKFFLFENAARMDYIWLLVIAILASAVSMYYYFRGVTAAFMKEPAGAAIEVPATLKVVLAVTSALTLLLGIAPNLVMGWFR